MVAAVRSVLSYTRQRESVIYSHPSLQGKGLSDWNTALDGFL